MGPLKRNYFDRLSTNELVWLAMGKEQVRPARRIAIEILLQRGNMSRSEIAEITGMSRSTIAGVIQDLLDSGMLRELPVVCDEQRRGRPAIPLALEPSHSYFIGANISEVLSSMVLTDLQGKVLAECELPFGSQPTEVTAHIRRGISQLLRLAHIERNLILGIGIAVAGVVDQGRGICLYSAPLGWRDVPIVDLVQNATGIPVYIDNDANATAIGQRLFGLARKTEHFVSILFGRTIGCAHYMAGRLYRGHTGAAGEIGHVTIDPSGPLCQCGKHGCLDVVAGGTALRAAARDAGFPVDSMRELELTAANGNQGAVALLRRAGQALGLAVANLVQINNPQTVLFADLEGFGNGLFYTTTRQAIENNILPKLIPSTQIVFQSVEYSFLARGAASVAAQAGLLVQGHINNETYIRPASRNSA
jgi:predicted NBD/HSP70 family sugar kinase